MRPLLVHLIFHPRSESARELARGLYRELHDDPNVPGLRVPVVFAPDDGSEHPPALDDLALHEARRNLVVLLADDAMVIRFSKPPAGRVTWGTFAGDLFDALNGGDANRVFMPVQVSEAAWPLDPRLESISFERAHGHEAGDARIKWLARRIVIRLYQLLRGEAFTDRAPIKLFVSHAKADLGPDSAVAEILDHHLTQTQPVATWVDSAQIPAGANFGNQIENGIAESSVLAIVTDNYSSRPWCRREILIAKRLQRPLIIIDALDRFDLRAFPYLGNVPRRRWSPECAADCVDLILKESLRVEMTRLELSGERDAPKHPTDQVLTSRPELATLIALAHDRPILYPDPPLSDEELDLLKQLHTGELMTPLQRVASNQRLAGLGIAISAGNSPDLGRRGLTDKHLEHTLLGLCLQLLVRGATLSYGGHLDAKGYTGALLDLTLAHQAQALPAVQPIQCYLAWSGAPMSPSVLQKLVRHQQAGDWNCIPRPEGVEALDPGRFVERLEAPLAPDSAIARYAISRSMTLMRERQTADLHARVVIGGKLGTDAGGVGWYSGLMPGILEEALLTMKANKPTFLIGAFGGAAGMIVDVLEGKERVEMDWAYHRAAPHIVAMRELYEHHHVDFVDYPAILAFLRARGWAGLNNGLSETENRELWHTRDLDRIVTLIIEGLANTPRS